MAGDKKPFLIGYEPSFSQQEYLHATDERRLELVMSVVRGVTKDLPRFNTSAKLHKYLMGTGDIPVACVHELQTMKAEADLYEKDKVIARLQQRIEDLCEEVKRNTPENRTFIFGPGAIE